MAELNLGPRMAPGQPLVAPWGSDRWPHYFSTYCIHQLHDQCRLTCKTCGQPCRCTCHRLGRTAHLAMMGE